MSKHYPPQYQASSFQCLHCQVHAHQHWEKMDAQMFGEKIPVPVHVDDKSKEAVKKRDGKTE